MNKIQWVKLDSPKQEIFFGSSPLSLNLLSGDNMECPKCGSERQPNAAECPQCGVIYEKWEAFLDKKQAKNKAKSYKKE